jgi:hypothetical protein
VAGGWPALWIGHMFHVEHVTWKILIFSLRSFHVEQKDFHISSL